MEELMDYFDSIGAQVNKETCSLEGKDFPEVLRELYDTVGSVDLPYGIIYNSNFPHHFGVLNLEKSIL